MKSWIKKNGFYLLVNTLLVGVNLWAGGKVNLFTAGLIMGLWIAFAVCDYSRGRW